MSEKKKITAKFFLLHTNAPKSSIFTMFSPLFFFYPGDAAEESAAIDNGC